MNKHLLLRTSAVTAQFSGDKLASWQPPRTDYPRILLNFYGRTVRILILQLSHLIFITERGIKSQHQSLIEHPVDPRVYGVRTTTTRAPSAKN